MNPVEIFAPAGNFESLSAALNAGADGVYFGVGRLNMRAGGAMNFTPEDLPEVVTRCHQAGAKAYLAVNTIIYDPELAQARELCERAKNAGIDGCIAGDPAVFAILRELHIPVHVTVQCNISNLESVKFYAQFADVMVLARELSLDAIRHIADGIREQNVCGPSGNLVKLELFAHGALCIGLSGRCGMSLCSYGKSSNRGECLQNCRRRYVVTDAETGVELEIDNQYIMSPKDICTIRFLDQIMESGVSILKIEGRGRPADYVDTTVRVYSEARAAVQDHTFTQEKALAWEDRLKRVFNRGFWDGGYYLGQPLDMWAKCGGSQAVIRKEHIGKISNYYAKVHVAAVMMETGILRKGDTILITGSKTGALEVTLAELRVDDAVVESAGKGQEVSFPVESPVRTGDRVQILINKNKVE